MLRRSEMCFLICSDCPEPLPSVESADFAQTPQRFVWTSRQLQACDVAVYIFALFPFRYFSVEFEIINFPKFCASSTCWTIRISELCFSRMLQQALTRMQQELRHQKMWN
jgi:hypothetical protein